MQPLLVGDAADVWVECAIEAGGAQLEVRSGEGSESASAQLGEAAQHFAAAPSDAALSIGQPLRLEALRRQATRPVDVTALYEAMFRAGLEYGPEHRRLDEAWAGFDAGAAVARLGRRRDWHGTRVHPADLDAALQLPMALLRGAAAETLLPFAVARSVLGGGSVASWAAVAQRGGRLPGRRGLLQLRGMA